MISGQSEGLLPGLDFETYSGEAGAFHRLCVMVESYARSRRVRTHAYLHASIRRLSIFANDEGMSVRTPERVATALRSYGHLLCARQVEALKDWLQKRAVA
jgi:hypothetical protein